MTYAVWVAGYIVAGYVVCLLFLMCDKKTGVPFPCDRDQQLTFIFWPAFLLFGAIWAVFVLWTALLEIAFYPLKYMKDKL